MAGKVIALLKRKGGSGSSTLAANLGVELQSRGLTVRVLDCDPQKSLTVWAGLGDGSGVLGAIVSAVDARPGSEFAALLGQHRSEADRVIIDCAPGFDPIAIQAASLADAVVIPVRPSPLDIAAAMDALEVAVIGARGRDGVAVCFAPSANLPRTRLGRELPEQLEQLGKEHGVSVLPSVSARIVVAEAAISGQAVREIEPGGQSAREFAAVADAIEAKI